MSRHSEVVTQGRNAINDLPLLLPTGTDLGQPQLVIKVVRTLLMKASAPGGVSHLGFELTFKSELKNPGAFLPIPSLLIIKSCQR